MKKTRCLSSKRDILPLVNVLEPLRQSPSPRFASFALTGRWFQHRRRKSRAFAFLGRCFVVARRGWTRKSAQQAGYRRERTEPLGTANASTLWTPRRKQIVGYSLIKSAAGIKPGRHHKAPFCRQGAATPANGPLRGAAPGQTASQTRRNGTGQLPACDLAGWLKVEAEGCRKGNHGPAHTTYPQGGEAASYLPLMRQGKGGCRVKLTTVLKGVNHHGN